MKKIIWGVLAAGLLAVTAGISAQSVPFDGISIPFDQEIYIVQEELENSADELLLTLLYASDPEIAADGEAEICEVESADIENSFRTYMENISTSGLDAVQPPVPIDADISMAKRHGVEVCSVVMGTSKKQRFAANIETLDHAFEKYARREIGRASCRERV